MTNQQDPPTSHPSQRPAVITSLAVVAALVSIFHLIKFLQVLRDWSVLAELSLLVPPIYLAADGLVWFITGGGLAWGLWKGRPWARLVGHIISLLYFLGFWIDRLWIANPDRLLRRWPVNLLISLASLALVLWSLNRPSSREYFQENPVKIT
jgi:hypothetical protein